MSRGRVQCLVVLVTFFMLMSILLGGCFGGIIRIATPCSFSGSPRSGDAPLQVQFDSWYSRGRISEWAWQFGDGETSSEANPTHVYASEGTYSVTLSVRLKDGGECSQVEADYIVVGAGSSWGCDCEIVLPDGLQGGDISLVSETYCLDDKITIRDGDLVIKDSSLCFRTLTSGEYAFDIEGYSTVLIEDSTIVSSSQEWNSACFGGEACLPGPTGPEGHVQGTVRRSQMPNSAFDIQLNTQYDFEDCLIGSVSVRYHWAEHASDIQVSLSDCTLAELDIRAYGRAASAHLSGLVPGFFVDWDLTRDNVLEDPDVQLSLVNTNVARWSLIIGGDKTLEIAQSQFAVWVIERASVTITDSLVETISFNNWSGTLDLANSTVEHMHYIGGSTGTISGEATFVNQEVNTWTASAITRYYKVNVVDEWGIPQAGVDVEAFSPTGSSIWIGTTDVQGGVEISVEFTDSDYSQLRRIELSATKDSTQIGFLSDTPVQLVETP
ncbi:PKD domain-containing protein [Candidatus Bipolaricaulota bacterium]